MLKCFNREVSCFFFCLFTFNCQAEARAEFAERSVQKLQKEVDRLEGKNLMTGMNLQFLSVLFSCYLSVS